MKKMLALFATAACVAGAVGCGWKAQSAVKKSEGDVPGEGIEKWMLVKGEDGEWTVHTD